MPEAPNPAQLLASILATTRIIEAEALMRFNTAPTLETTNTIIDAFLGASLAMRPASFAPGPCGGVHVVSMCWPKALVERWLRPIAQEFQEGRAIGPNGDPFPLLK